MEARKFKRKEEEIDRLDRELRAINACHQVLQRASDEQWLCNNVCRIICEEAGYRMAWVGMAEHDDGKSVRPFSWSGEGTGYLASANITWADAERGRGPTGTCIREGKTRYIEDFGADEGVAAWREMAERHGYCSSIGLALLGEDGAAFGALTIYSERTHAFSAEEIHLLEALAKDLAFGITTLRSREEQKRVERSLRQREEEYRNALLESQTTLEAIIESTLDLIWAVGCRGFGFLTFNRSLREYFLQHRGIHIERGMRPEDLYTDSVFVQRWRDFYERALKEGPYTTEYVIFAGTRVLQLRFSLLQRHERVFGVAVFGKDITERKRTEQKIERQIAFEGLVNKLLAGFASATAAEIDARVSSSLKEVGEFMGAEHAHVVQISDRTGQWSFTHEWSAAGMASLMERYQNLPTGAAPWVEACLRTGEAVLIRRVDEFPPEAEIERQRHIAEGIKSSLRVPLHGRSGMFRGCLGLFTFSREVAWSEEEIRWLRILADAIANALERKQAEERLRDSEERFRTLIEKAPSAIGISRNGIALYVNDRFRGMFGFGTGDEVIGRPISEHWAPESRKLIEERAMHRSKGLPVPTEYEGVGLRRDGGQFPVHVAVTVVELPDGPATLGFLTDISERKDGERRLRASREQLRALTGRLESLREEERTRLSREIHDHLGQLLTALKLDLRSLERKTAGVTAPEPRTLLARKIVSARGLADEMITSVQKIASELRPGILDRLGLVPAIEVEVQAFQERTGISCEAILPATAKGISAEQTTAVFRIAQEVLTNVARHAQATRVKVRMAFENEELVLEINDNGKGMPADAAENSKSLGLLGMQERATMVGGRIRFKGEAGGGTNVTLQIPLTQAIERPL